MGSVLSCYVCLSVLGLRGALFQILCSFTWRFSQTHAPSIPFSPSQHFWIPTSSSRVFLILLPALLQHHSKPLCQCSDLSSHFLALIDSLTLLSLTQLSCSTHFFPFFQNPHWLDPALHVSEELRSPLKMQRFSALQKNVSPAAAFSSSLTEVGRSSKYILTVFPPDFCALVRVDGPTFNQKHMYLYFCHICVSN